MSRESRIVDQMDLLGIKDVSTPRQAKNGTVVWRLPIKYSTHNKFIEVASFKTGYVRNQNGGYTNYQLNKRVENQPQYYKNYKWNEDMTEQTFTGTYRKFVTRGCKLMPNEIDRLEYLIAYCLKNYYIKNANKVINGDYVSRWEHEWCLERATSDSYNDGVARWRDSEVNDRDIIHELESSNYKFSQKIKDLEAIADNLSENLDDMTKARDYYKAYNNFNDSMYEGRNDEVKNLENKLATIERIANDRNKWNG